MNNSITYDCIIVGGGIGGLMAAIYLARFCLNFKIFDDNASRAQLISKSHNFPAFPDGISGKDILSRLREQLHHYSTIDEKTVTNITRSLETNLFQIHTKDEIYLSKTVILATGVSDLEPALPNLESAIKKGLIRHCMICDGYEVKNQKIGVLANSKSGLNLACSLSSFSKDVTLLYLGKRLQLTEKEKNKLFNAGVKIIKEPIIDVQATAEKISLIQTTNNKFSFDTIYSALGTSVNSQFAISLGAKHTRDGCLLVNSHQESSVPGLYAIGDIVEGLSQMCVATSQAAIAATQVFTLLKDYRM